MKLKSTLVFFFAAVSAIGYSQEDKTKPLYKGKMGSVEYMSPMMSRPNDLIKPDTIARESKDKRSLGPQLKDQSIRRRRRSQEDDILTRNRSVMEQSIPNEGPSLVFDAYRSPNTPTDPTMAVGPEHVMVVFNTAFTIYDKEGNQLLAETRPTPAIFPMQGTGDMTISYDNSADRWVISFLTAFEGGAQIAISDGPNPLTSGWFVYEIPEIQDYQKLSIWSDGYYITDNSFNENKLWILERDAMLVGDPNAQIAGFDLPGFIDFGFVAPQVLNITDDNMPAPGGATIVYMQDDDWEGVDRDHIKVWTADVDWSNLDNSRVSDPTEIDVTPFLSVFDDGEFENLDQPNGGQPIDALQATIMNQAQFRKFETHNSAVFNFVVDTDGTEGKLAGIRWYEFRQDGDNQPWSLYQEGTYNAPDGKHAWMASLAMDGQGNIGMGYSSMSGPTTPSDVFVGSYFTGRSSGDPLGVMTQMESLISSGEGLVRTVRYGDYSKIDVDPVDDATFWYITERATGLRTFDTSGVVGRFQIQAADQDIESPTAPTNIVVSNTTDTSATLNWTESTDNVRVTGYNIFLDDEIIGTSTTTALDISDLLPSTTYTVRISAEDAAGNISGNTTVTFTTLANEELGVIAAYFFETGFDGWIDGGSDCFRARNASRAFEGRHSIRLRDNSVSSNVTSPEINLRRNSQVSIEFHVFPNSMEPGEDFFVEFYNGRNYEVIGNYVSGVDFENNVFFTDTITLDSVSFRFIRRNKFRFRCDASNNRDRIYIDAVTVSGDNAPLTANNTNALASISPVEPETIRTLSTFTDASEKNINMYPNPVVSELTIDIAKGVYDEITIYSLIGEPIYNINPKEESALTIDVSNLASGMYFARFTSKEGLAVTKRFIKE